MKLGTPKDYAFLYRASKTDEYRRQLLNWLDEQSPGFSALVHKELARTKKHAGSKGNDMPDASDYPTGERDEAGGIDPD